MTEKAKVIHERNKTVVIIYWAALLFAILGSIINKNSFNALVMRIVSGGICGITATILTYKHWGRNI